MNIIVLVQLCVVGEGPTIEWSHLPRKIVREKSLVLVRTRETAFGPRSRLEADGGAAAVLVELFSSDHTFSKHVPLSAFKKGKLVLNCREATRALLLIAVRAGVDSKRVSLHSLRVGTATVLAARGEIAERVIRREADGNREFTLTK